jgi:hypothetical protein
MGDNQRQIYLLRHGWQTLLDDLGGDMDALSRLSCKHGVALGYRHAAYRGLSAAMARFDETASYDSLEYGAVYALDNWFQRTYLQVMDGNRVLDPIHEQPLFDAVNALLNSQHEWRKMTDND